MKTGESYKVQLADLEETLLQELAAAEGNILENKSYGNVLMITVLFEIISSPLCSLLASLNETKVKSSVISESLREASELQV